MASAASSCWPMWRPVSEKPAATPWAARLALEVMMLPWCAEMASMAAENAAKKGGAARRAAMRMGPSAALAGGWMEARATESGRPMSFPRSPATKVAV